MPIGPALPPKNEYEKQAIKQTVRTARVEATNYALANRDATSSEIEEACNVSRGVATVARTDSNRILKGILLRQRDNIINSRDELFQTMAQEAVDEIGILFRAAQNTRKSLVDDFGNLLPQEKFNKSGKPFTALPSAKDVREAVQLQGDILKQFANLTGQDRLDWLAKEQTSASLDIAKREEMDKKGLLGKRAASLQNLDEPEKTARKPSKLPDFTKEKSSIPAASSSIDVPTIDRESID